MKKKRKNNGIRVIILAMLYLWLFSTISYAESQESTTDHELSEQITCEGPVFTEKQKPEKPAEYMEQGGKKYRLVSSELIDATKRGTITYVSSTIPYELEGMQEAPETAWIKIKDETTGKQFEREVSKKEVIEKDTAWKDDFSFSVTVFGYDADMFYLGDHEIPANTDLAEYGEQLLESLDLPIEYYMVESVEWSGEPYERDGMMCRDAAAYGKKLVRYVDVVYGGQVRTPDVPGKRYLAVYEEIEPETLSETDAAAEITENETMVETEPIIEIQQEDRLVDRIVRWVKEHITVVVFSSFFLLLAFGWGCLLYLTTKKKKEKAGD